MNRHLRLNRYYRAIITFFMGAFLFIGLQVPSSEAQQAPRKRFVITGGTVGAPIYAVGGLLGTLIDEKIPGANASVTTGQGFTALEQVVKGEAQIGMCGGDVIANAYAGREPFKEPRKNIRILGKLAGLYYQFIILSDKNISSMEEIKEKRSPLRLTTSPKGSLSEFSTRKVLEAYGITFQEIAKWGGKVSHVSWADSGNLMRDGHADAVSLYGVVPIPVFSELEMSRPIKLLAPSSEMLKKLVVSLGGHNIVPIRAGVYKAVDKPVQTLGTFQTLIARADMAEEDAYQICKLAFDPDHIKKFKGLLKDYGDALTPEQAADGLAAPLHPGAERYYRERGWFK